MFLEGETWVLVEILVDFLVLSEVRDVRRENASDIHGGGVEEKVKWSFNVGNNFWANKRCLRHSQFLSNFLKQG